MGTKWKNITEDIKHFLKKNYKILAELLLMAAGVFCFYSMIAYRGWHPTGESIFYGVLGILFAGSAIYFFLKGLLAREYEKWIPDEEDSYAGWEETGQTVGKWIGIAGGILFLLSLWYFAYLVRGGNYQATGWYYNLAAGYMSVFSVMLLFIEAQTVLHIFQKKQLDYMMEQMENLNRRRLDVALEIEKKSLEKVSRSDQLRVDLITNVSHDLKTPLTSMVGYIELIRKEELDDTVRDYVDVISDRAEKLKEMVNSLFSLAKASSGNIELHPEKFELNRMIEQIFADMDDQIKSSGLEFVTRLTEESTEIISDNSYFYRICQNLFENALKYSARGTRVFVTTYIRRKDINGSPMQGKLCMELTNTSAYPMDFTKEDIVERFARGDKARSGDGNGLGLAIVSSYVKALGGEFDIKIDCDQFKACVMMPIPNGESASVGI